MKVSIIIPNYNHASFLQERIESILNQSFQNFELIILDDFSSDNSRKIIEAYRNHPKVSHVVYNEVNSGTTFKQWNKGIALAQGEAIWIAESDDSSHPQFLEKVIAALHQNPKASIAFANSRRMDAQGGFHGDWTENYHGEETKILKKDFIMQGEDLAAGPMLLLNAIPNASSAVFRKKAALLSGPAPENFKLVGDWFYWVQLLMQGDVVFLSDPLNYFRFHENTVRKSSQKQGQGLLEILEVLASIKSWKQPNRKTEKLSVQYLLYGWNQAIKNSALNYASQLKIYNKIMEVFPAFKTTITKEFLKILFRQARS